jgi:hypothetical protein
MPGILIAGRIVEVPGVRVLSPHELPWVSLDAADCRPRTNDPQQWILHKTLGDDHEQVLDGAGPSADYGGDEDSAKDWQSDSRHAGSHLIVGYDGTVADLADLARYCAWHDGNVQSNMLSVGLEMKEKYGGGCFAVTFAAAVEVTAIGMSELGIQWQCPRHYRNNVPFPRFADGGRNLVGCFGHRDVTDHRGYHDPGDLIFDMLESTHHFERFDFYGREDLDVWSARQERLHALGYYAGAIDGIPGKHTTAALAAAGFPAGIYARGRELAEQLGI